MNEEREKIIKQIHETPTEDLVKSTPKKSKGETFKEVVKEILLWRFRFIGAILGVTEENIASSGKISRHGPYESGRCHTPQRSEGNSFKESYKFDPSKAYMERIQENAYFKMIDGKGDHDCDHEH